MNTSDIRDLNAGQGLFWAVAVPFTTFITSLTILTAFKGTAIMQVVRKHADRRPLTRFADFSRLLSVPTREQTDGLSVQHEAKYRWRSKPKRTNTFDTIERGER